jgi:hypothetical protein
MRMLPGISNQATNTEKLATLQLRSRVSVGHYELLRKFNS